MAISTLINQFGVTQVPITVNSDIRFNITKRKETVLYKTLTDIDTINLAYVVNNKLNSEKNVFISDKSTGLSANRIPENIQPTIIYSKTITLPVDKFKVTDIFITSITQEKVPLFNKHILKNFNSLDPNTTLHDFSIRDKNFRSIEIANVIFDKDNGILYNNIDNVIDNFYYINYSIQDSFTNNIISYTEILDNEDIFKQAEIDDIDTTGQLITDRKVYLVEGFSSNVFEVSFPIVNYYAILEEPNSKIRLLLPPSTDNENAWFLSVTNGNFFAAVNISPSTYSIFKYNLPEFNTQLFNPEAPFKFRQSEICTQIDNKLLQTLKANLVIDTDKFIDVILRNPDETPRLAFTNDPTKLNTTFENVIVYEDGIRSIDRKNGILDLKINILDTDIIEVSYYYIETEYELIDIDFNPIHNSLVLEKRLVFYIVPNTNDSRSKTLYYLIVNNQGIIEVGNQTDNISLVSDITNGTLTYDVPSIDSSHLNFIDKYTVQAVDNFKFANSTNPKYLILGDVFVNINDKASNTTIFDVRQAGGGIKKIDGLLQTLAQIDPEISWTTETGRWDGITYPGNGSMMIELPTSIQKQNGGLFTDTELREIVERHMGFGLYSVMRSYGSDIHPVVEVL